MTSSGKRSFGNPRQRLQSYDVMQPWQIIETTTYMHKHIHTHTYSTVDTILRASVLQQRIKVQR